MQGQVRALPGQLRGAAAVGSVRRGRSCAPVGLQGAEGRVRTASVFNTLADAFENVYATEFANIL